MVLETTLNMADHPFRAWRERAELTREQVVERLQEQRNRKTSAGYVALVEQGWRVPSFDFAEDLAALAKGDVSVVEIMRWRRPEKPATDTPDAA